MPDDMAGSRRHRWVIRLLTATGAAAVLSGAAGGLGAQLPGVGRPAPLVESAGNDLFPTLAPDGALAFSRRDGGDWDVFLQAPGEEAVNLTADSDGDDWQAEFSPDGDRLVFRSERDGGGLYVMDRGGGAIRRLTNVGFNPSWSPNGEEIVYSSTQIVADPASRPIPGDLSIVRVATGERRLLYALGDAVQPRWSPSGERIAFWAFAAQGGQRDLWTVSASGGEAVAVTRDAATDWSPAWSPSGAFLYFASDRQGDMDIWRVAIAQATGQVQGAPEQITSGALGIRGHLAISSDGRRLVFAEDNITTTVEALDFEPVAGRVDGDARVVLEASTLAFDVAPSPDGQSLVFYSRAHSGSAPEESIYVTGSRGGPINRVTSENPGGRDRGPVWSPDSSRIAFYSDRSGNYEIWTVDPDGSNLTQVTRDPAANRSGILWSPDGARLLYRQRSGPSRDTYVIDPVRRPIEQVLEALPAIGGSDEYFAASSWSSDGSQIAGTRVYVNRAAQGGVFLYDTAARTFRILTPGGDDPQWLNDDRRLIYTDGASRLMLVDTTQLSPPREILSIAPRLLDSARLSADNRTLFYRAAVDESSLWQVSLP